MDLNKVEMRLEITFGKTNSPNLKNAIRKARALPGYSATESERGVIHNIDILIPFGDAQLWERLRDLLSLIGSWKSTSVKFEGKECQQSWRLLGDISQVVACYGRRPSDKRGEDYCCGKKTPTDDVTTFGCHFIKGVDLTDWGDTPWFHFGTLENNNSEFNIDKNLIVETIKAATEAEYCLSCPAFSWQLTETILAQLPDKIELTNSKLYSLRYSEADPSHPIGIMRKEEPYSGLRHVFSINGSNDEANEETTVGRNVPTIHYKDVAGQERAVEVVRDVCELPLKYADYFEHLRLTPHRGVEAVEKVILCYINAIRTHF